MPQTQKMLESLKRLAHANAHILDNIVSNPVNSSLKNTPVFENGHLTDVKPTSVVDYLKVKRQICHEKNIINTEAFQDALDGVIEVMKKTAVIGKIDEGDKARELAKAEVCNFLTQYAGERYEGRSGQFTRAVKQFRSHIVSELSFFTYIAPLYNVRGDFSEIGLSNKTKIRTTTNNEYKRIVGMRKTLKEIDYHQKRLRFVIEHIVDPKTKQSLDEIKNEYAFVTNLIRLTHNGKPEFGQIYLVNSARLNTVNIQMVESRESTPQPPGFVTLTSKDSIQLNKIYNNLKTKFNKGKKSRFLANAISRYGMACRHTSSSNKIVDYVISLEALLIENSGETTLKLAHRASALCAANDKDRIHVWEFIKSVYKFRSGIVHRSAESPFIINSKTLSIDEVTHRLDRLTSKAILRMNSIMDSVDSKDEIVGFLDRSIYDKSLLLKLEKLWK